MVTSQGPSWSPQKNNQWKDSKGGPLVEVQEAKPPGGFQGGALGQPRFKRLLVVLHRGFRAAIQKVNQPDESQDGRRLP
jgi:hypothetical protein